MSDWHSPEDIKRLDDALLALPEEHGGMLLSELDGFCVGLLVCPEMIPPSEWLAQVWGSRGAPEFDSMEQMQSLMNLIMGHYNRVATMLTPPAYFAPVIDEVDATGEVLWEFWMDGFMSVVALRPDAWKNMSRGDDTNASFAMLEIFRLARFGRERSKYSQTEQAEKDDYAVDFIIDSVLEINRFTKGLPPEALFDGMPWDVPANQAHDPFATTKVGRNVPCPCGSGRKYKKCCGAN